VIIASADKMNLFVRAEKQGIHVAQSPRAEWRSVVTRVRAAN